MPITISLLIIVVLFFAVRGATLGFLPWLTRSLSLIIAYTLAYSYRYNLAESLQLYFREIPFIAAQIISSICLFFIGLLATKFFISGLVDTITIMKPKFAESLHQNNLFGRGFAATGNSCIAVFIVLIGLHIYSQAQHLQLVPVLSNNNQILMDVAKYVGNKSFGALTDCCQNRAFEKKTQRENITRESIKNSHNNLVPINANDESTISLQALRDRHQQQFSKLSNLDINNDKSPEFSTPTLGSKSQSESQYGTSESHNLLALSKTHVDSHNKQAITEKMNYLLDDQQELRKTLNRLLPEQRANAISDQLEAIMQNPTMKQHLRDSIQELIKNPTKLTDDLTEILQNRHSSNN